MKPTSKSNQSGAVAVVDAVAVILKRARKNLVARHTDTAWPLIRKAIERLDALLLLPLEDLQFDVNQVLSKLQPDCSQFDANLENVDTIIRAIEAEAIHLHPCEICPNAYDVASPAVGPGTARAHSTRHPLGTPKATHGKAPEARR